MYLLLPEFEARTAHVCKLVQNQVQSPKRMGHKSKEEKTRIRKVQYGPTEKTKLVLDIFIISPVCLMGSGTISINDMEGLQISDTHPKQNKST